MHISHMPATEPTQDDLKKQAAIFAVQFIQPGMTVGLGTGSTAIHAVREIARRHAANELPGIQTFATSSDIARLAESSGLPLIDAQGPASIDVTVDGADEVDPQLNLIKGGGGALFHEKVVAQSTHREIIVIDESKMSPTLGTKHALPIEVIPFGSEAQRQFLIQLGGHPSLRLGPEGTPFITDEGNYIYDCQFGPIADPEELAAELRVRTGVVEHGLFLGMTSDLIIGTSQGLRHLRLDPSNRRVAQEMI